MEKSFEKDGMRAIQTLPMSNFPNVTRSRLRHDVGENCILDAHKFWSNQDEGVIALPHCFGNQCDSI